MAVLEATRRECGADHRDTLGATANLATTDRNWGRLAEAVGLQDEALSTTLQVLGAGYPGTCRAVPAASSTGS